MKVLEYRTCYSKSQLESCFITVGEASPTGDLPLLIRHLGSWLRQLMGELRATLEAPQRLTGPSRAS